MKTLIVSGGNVSNKFMKKLLLTEHFENIIAVDKGLEVLDKLGVMPNFIIGDFDSVNPKILEKYGNYCQIDKLPQEKDWTDTFFALELAIKIRK